MVGEESGLGDAEEAQGESPWLSVVITTHNRPAGVMRAISSVAIEGACPEPIEIVVVDDGSHADAAEALDQLDHPHVQVVHQADLGLAAARATGVAVSRGQWLAFLDDDDRWLPAWRDELLPLTRRPGVGFASGAARFVTPDDQVTGHDPPRRLGPVYSGAVAQYLAGCFAVRREVYELAGGYLPGLSSSHQSELFIRLAAVCDELGLELAATTAAVADIERRLPTERTLSNPRLQLDGIRWILARHSERFAADRVERSYWRGIAAVNALRLGDPSAVAHAWSAVKDLPRSTRAWVRLALVVSGVGRRRWGGTDEYVSPSPSHRVPLQHAASLRHDPVAELVSTSDLLFLPWRYRENPPASADAHGTPFWEGGTERNDVRYQTAVYRWAARLARRDGGLRVLDIGCGSGHKLARHVAPVAARCVGVDQGSALAIAREEFPDREWFQADLSEDGPWDELRQVNAQLVICSDVIEHLPDPHQLLVRLRSVVAPGGRILLSTPDRSRLEDRDPLGPPHNPRHIREWNEPELRLLVESAGLRVVQARHLLPRAYSPTLLELKRTVHRALHRRAVPDRRTSLALLLEPSTSH